MKSMSKALILLLFLFLIVLSLSACDEIFSSLLGDTTAAGDVTTTGEVTTATTATTGEATTTTATGEVTTATTAATTTATAATTTAATTAAEVTTAPPAPPAEPSGIVYNTEKKAIGTSDRLAPWMFGASYTYPDGSKGEIEVTYVGTYAAGEIIDVTLSVVGDEDVAPVTIEGVKVYTTPRLRYDTSIRWVSDTDTITAQTFSATATDSFGEPLEIAIFVEGDLVAGNEIVVHMDVVDAAGNEYGVALPHIMVYGAPVISYDDTVLWISDTGSITSKTFSATATDSFGLPLSVSVSMEGERVSGNKIAVTLTAQDAYGHVGKVTLPEITVCGAPTISYNAEKEIIKFSDTVNAALFDATAVDAFGNPCNVDVRIVRYYAGSSALVVFTATDVRGITGKVEMNDVKIYGMPTVTIGTALYADTNVTKMATVTDSFGQRLNAEVTYTGTLADGERVTVNVKATDTAGNLVDRTYSYIVNHDTHTFVNGVCSVCSDGRAYTRTGNYIYFGEYPQTIKAADVTITDTVDSRGYYLGSDGFYYAKVVSTPFEQAEGYRFSNNEAVLVGTVYYFKVEPIRWRVLAEEGGAAFILCDSIIDAKAYEYSESSSVATSNYKESDIRAWLNATFYDTAFSTLQQALIRVTTVDNSAATTGNADNKNACEDTEDKMFLLSYAEALSVEYGFSSDNRTADKAKKMLTSDYSRAVGAYVCSHPTDLGNGYWWFRSPEPGNRSYVWCGHFNGAIDSYADMMPFSSWIGVVPACWITLQ